MGTDKRSFFVYEVYVGSVLRHLVSPLEPDDVAEHGLAAESVVGLLAVGVDGPGAMQPDHFEENPAFVRFLHETIADDIFVVHGLREQAALVGGHGWVDVLDARTPTSPATSPRTTSSAVSRCATVCWCPCRTGRTRRTGCSPRKASSNCRRSWRWRC
ncbi:hypothetical protein [Dactylosporangium cerinum]